MGLLLRERGRRLANALANRITVETNLPTLFLRDEKLLYVDIPKAGCSSVRHFLLSAKGLSTKKLHNQQSLRLTRKDDLREVWCFTFVRDPLERLISCYRDKIRHPRFQSKRFKDGVESSLWRYGLTPGLSFGEFVRFVANVPDVEADHHFRSQSDIISPFQEVASALDFKIWWIEEMASTLASLRKLFPPQQERVSGQIVIRNKSLKNPGVQEGPIGLDKATLDLVQSRYSADYTLREHAEKSSALRPPRELGVR